jgi:hypothetical protein
MVNFVAGKAKDLGATLEWGSFESFLFFTVLSHLW